MLPFLSLDAASVPTIGAVRDLEGVHETHTLQVVVTGSPTSFQLDLQGSMDGSTWFRIDTANTSVQLTTGRHLARYVRANLQTVTGGTSPTFTAWIASA